MDERGGRRRRIRGIQLVLASLAIAGIGATVTSAAWTDAEYDVATMGSSTFDIQARFASDAPWGDVGLPGNPDTWLDGNEIAIPPIKDVLPSHSYAGDVFLCNAGDVDGRITDATLEEITTNKNGAPSGPDLRLVEPGSIEVDNIDVGTIIPAHSCEPSTVADPPNDVHGIIHFTTIPDFTGQYGSTTKIVIKIIVTSEPSS